MNIAAIFTVKRQEDSQIIALGGRNQFFFQMLNRRLIRGLSADTTPSVPYDKRQALHLMHYTVDH